MGDDLPLTDPGSPQALASDRERDQAIALVNAAFAQGRLDDDEHGRRLQIACTARVRADLHHALEGIPAPPRVTGAMSARAARAVATGATVMAALASVGALAVIASSDTRLDAPRAGERVHERATQATRASPVAAHRAAEVQLAHRYLDAMVAAQRAVHARDGRYTDTFEALVGAYPPLGDLVALSPSAQRHARYGFSKIDLSTRADRVTVRLGLEWTAELTVVLGSDGQATRRCAGSAEQGCSGVWATRRPR